MTTSSVERVGGVPTLHIDGVPVPGAAYLTYFPRRNRYGDFAAAGYRLFSLPLYFAEDTINQQSPCPPFDKGIFDTALPDFAHVDEEIGRILAACPEAYIFPRVNVNLPRAWEAAHPDELCDGSYFGEHRVCFASDAWAEEVKRLLALLLSHMENAPYRDRIVGYQIAGGNTEEWFPLDPCGSSGKRAREKFAALCRETGRDSDEESYWAFLSEVIADRICELAAFAKNAVAGRVVIGAFYGYTFECPQRNRCHHALRRVLASPDVDFICSPVSYAGVRRAGRDHSCMLPVDSLKVHGKLYFAENDTRTHLSAKPFDIPKFDHPIWFGPDEEQSVEIIKMHAARALTHGHAFWWFDMWGGWYRTERYMATVRRVREIVAESLSLPRGSAAELALFTDERAYAHIAPDGMRNISEMLLSAMGEMGAPYDAYLADDFDAVADRYKAFVLLAPVPTEKTEQIRRALGSRPCLVVTADTPDAVLSASYLGDFATAAGVHLFTDAPAVVYASASHLFLHTVADGLLDLCDGERERFTDLFTGEVLTFPREVKKGRSYLFRRKNSL